jgi:hypothetical protein
LFQNKIIKMAKFPQLDRLKSQLLTSGLSQKDNPLFQIINQLIDALRSEINFTSSVLDPSGGGGGLGSQSFVTINSELGTLPNSRQLTAGTGITLRRTTSRIIIDASPIFQGRTNGRDEISRSFGFGLGIQGPRGLPGKDGFNSLISRSGECECLYRFPIPGAIINPAPITQEVLAANRTYFVLTTGSDSNDGFANTTAGAFLTIQHAIDVAIKVNTGPFTITIQVGTGTYAPFQLKSFIGTQITIQGDDTTPSNVVISNSTAATPCIKHNTSVQSYWKVSGFKLTNSGTGGSDGIQLFNSFIEVGVLELGAITRYAFNINNAKIQNTGNLTFSGNCDRGIFGQGNAFWNHSGGLTYTFSGTPAWGTAFCYASGPVFLSFFATISGAATGKRYLAELNGVIQTNGGGINYFPGNVAGTTATGGQYA